MYEQVQEKLNSIRPYLQRDGGDVELVEVNNDGVVYLRLTGVCATCPISTVTLKIVVQKALTEICGVTGIEQVS